MFCCFQCVSLWNILRDLGEKGWQVHPAWPCHDQDSLQEGHQGWKEDDVRQGGKGQATACQDRGESVPRRSFETSYLRQLTGSNLGVAKPGFGGQHGLMYISPLECQLLWIESLELASCQCGLWWRLWHYAASERKGLFLDVVSSCSLSSQLCT